MLKGITIKKKIIKPRRDKLCKGNTIHNNKLLLPDILLDNLAHPSLDNNHTARLLDATK